MVGAVLQHVGVGEKEERDLAHAVIDRSRGASDAARRRAAAGVDLLAEADLEPQHVGRGLRPERIGGAGAGQARHHQAVDLVLVDAGLVEQLLENLARQHPDVAVALLHHLGFGVGYDRVVTQAHHSLPIAVQAAVGVAVVPAKRARLCRLAPSRDPVTTVGANVRTAAAYWVPALARKNALGRNDSRGCCGMIG